MMTKQQLKAYRFDPPGGWRWKCRFSLEELKEIYLKLFGYTWFELNPNRALKSIETYNVGEDEIYGMVRLEDGGRQSLASCTIEELDWFLFIGESFINWKNRLDKRIPNILYGKLDRYEALISLDIDG